MTKLMGKPLAFSRQPEAEATDEPGLEKQKPRYDGYGSYARRNDENDELLKKRSLRSDDGGRKTVARVSGNHGTPGAHEK